MNRPLGCYVDLKHRRTCWVCHQETLPTAMSGESTDPQDPNRYKTCNVCREKVSYSVRRTQAYQRRWDEENARNMWSYIQYLRDIQSAKAEPE